jgi:hypothetical protein
VAGTLVFALTMNGMIEASATRKPCIPWTRKCASTTESGSQRPAGACAAVGLLPDEPVEGGGEAANEIMDRRFACARSNSVGKKTDNHGVAGSSPAGLTNKNKYLRGLRAPSSSQKTGLGRLWEDIPTSTEICGDVAPRV